LHDVDRAQLPLISYSLEVEAVATLEDLSLGGTNFAVVDVETTGFGAAQHRIVELAIVHLDPGGEPCLVFDSLILPDRRVGNRSIHGINNRVVRKAPKLVDVAGTVCDLFSDRILVAHNVEFDSAFLGRELGLAQVRWPLPRLCTMKLHRALHGGKANLETACTTVGIPCERDLHLAREDAQLTALLLAKQLDELASRGVVTVRELLAFAPAALLESAASLFSSEDAAAIHGRAAPHPRPAEHVDRANQKPPPASPTYMGALGTALGKRHDRAVLEQLRALQGGASLDALAAQHAATFGRWLAAEAAAGTLDPARRKRIQLALSLLADLGWAPGE
jgi:DNA polymerase-3 subunit epsilon